MKRGRINRVFVSSRMAVIPELREKIKKRLCEEGYEVLPGDISGQTSKDKNFNVDIYNSIRELYLRDVLNSDALVAVLGYGYGNTSESKYERTGIS